MMSVRSLLLTSIALLLTTSVAGAQAFDASEMTTRFLAQNDPIPGASSTGSGSSSVSSTNSTSITSSEASDYAISDYRVRLETRETRFNLGVYAQVSQFSFMGRSLLGNALEVAATYAIKQNIAATISVAQALSLEGGLTLAYTGIRAAGSYAWWGSFIRTQSVVVVNGQSSVETKSGATSMLASEVGIDQFLFNGSSRVIPATGASLGVRYDRTFGSFRASFIARYGMLVAQSSTSSIMTGGGGLVYSF